jgi:predicted site-specific integrase-resolvase
VDAEQLAQILGVCVKTVRRYYTDQGLPYIKLGAGRNTAIRFNIADVRKWVEGWRTEHARNYNLRGDEH